MSSNYRLKPWPCSPPWRRTSCHLPRSFRVQMASHGTRMHGKSRSRRLHALPAGRRMSQLILVHHSTITDLILGSLDPLTATKMARTSVVMIERYYGHLRQKVAACARSAYPLGNGTSCMRSSIAIAADNRLVTPTPDRLTGDRLSHRFCRAIYSSAANSHARRRKHCPQKGSRHTQRNTRYIPST